MKTIMISLLMLYGLMSAAQGLTGINPNNAQQGQSLSTAITSSGLFMTSSSPQGNIERIILKNNSDSVFALTDSTVVVNTGTANTFWNIPSGIGIGVYNLIVRLYNSLSQTSADSSLVNAFTISPLPGDSVSISPGAAQAGTSFYTTVSSSGLFILGSIPQGNIQAILLKNATDSVFANPDSTIAVNSHAASAYWTIPAATTTGMYDLVVRIYDPSISTYTDYTMVNGFRIFFNLISISPNQSYQGDSLYTTITSSGLFMNGSSPQGNIENIILKNSTDSVYAVSDSTDVVSLNMANAFWKIPANLASGLYTLIVRIYNDLFSGPTTDYTLTNSFSVSAPVWPGDADNNRVVDNNDLLPIGLVYGISGPPRSVQGMIWQAYAAADWADSFTNYLPAVNYKFADCDGNGTITASDTLAIMQNFSLTHNKSAGGYGQWRSGIPAIIPVVSRDTLYNGDTLTVSFVLGDSSIPASHIYGIAFTYNFDPLIVDSNYTTVSYPNSWFGSTDKISISKIFNDGQIKMALTRIDHTTRSGGGSIGQASFKITTDNISGVIQGGQYVNVGYISNVTIIDSIGDPIPTNAGADSGVVNIYPTGVHAISGQGLRIQPNPAETKVMISTDQAINEISITDINGKQVCHQSGQSGSSAIIDISTYADGLYFVQVITARGVRTEKLLVAR